jgi:hypothetical protein
MVPPRDSDALSAAVASLARDAEQRLALGHQARDHVLKFFALDRMLNAIETIYHTAWSKTAIIY